MLFVLVCFFFSGGRKGGHSRDDARNCGKVGSEGAALRVRIARLFFYMDLAAYLGIVTCFNQLKAAKEGASTTFFQKAPHGMADMCVWVYWSTKTKTPKL